MDRHLIKALIEQFAASNLAELEYSNGGATLRLVRDQAAALPASIPKPRPYVAVQPAPSAAPTPADQVLAAPLYGVVHLQRSPGAPPLVAVGQAVAAGQPLCLIEAMKVFTELRAEAAGTVTAILVDSGQDVEAGQPLMRLA